MNSSLGHEWDQYPLDSEEQVLWSSIVSEIANLQQQHMVSQILKGNKTPQTNVTCDRIQLSARKIWKPVTNSTEVN